MSIFKPFLTSDVIVSPFKLNKTFLYVGTNTITGSGIDLYLGENINPQIWSSGSNPTGYNSIQDSYLIYRSVRELYYTNFLYGDDGSPSNTASFNEDGTITGLQYTPNYYNYLSNTLPANRYFPTGSNDVVGVISIPSNLYGEYIKPGSFYLSSAGGGNTVNDYVDDDYVENYFVLLSASLNTIILRDDGQGSILYGSEKVGDIIYEHGIIILTNDGTANTSSIPYPDYEGTLYDSDDTFFIEDFIQNPNLVCSFNSTITIYESQYKCTIRENEFNFSQNPSLISGSSNSGVIINTTTGSYFSPYVTTVGLYNNNKELLAVAKLSQPLPISKTTDTSILINLDK